MPQGTGPGRVPGPGVYVYDPVTGTGTVTPIGGAPTVLDRPPTPVDSAMNLGFLGLIGAIGLGLAAAPVLYTLSKSRKRGKKARTDLGDDYTFLALEGASNRSVSLLAAVAPAFALPIAYLGIEDLEQRGIIGGEIGDRVQALIAAGAVAPAIGSVIGSVLGGVGKLAYGLRK